ncbi:hypothetical protein GUITHDRAFT_64330, partial [Guillardia theta CCMP2712]
TREHSTAQHSTAQHSTAQHSTAQHSTAQHSTAQHSRCCVMMKRAIRGLVEMILGSDTPRTDLVLSLDSSPTF